MAKKIGPYVGVTGFMSRNEVTTALSFVPKESTRRLMVGVLMSSKTLAGEEDKWPGRYPKKEAVADIFVDHPQALNLIHYSTDDPHTLLEQLVQVTELAGPHLDGFQLNIPWPDLPQIEAYRRANPEKFLVLQIGATAMLCTDNLTASVSIYHTPFDAVLFDMSGGKGKLLDPLASEPHLRALDSLFPSLGIGIAGGLGPDTLHVLDQIIPNIRNMSIDAEDQLRSSFEDMLDPYKVQTYLEDAFPLLDGEERPGTKLVRVCRPYGLAEHAGRAGLGNNMLRTEHIAQPRALKAGDLLATGDTVLSPPRQGRNGSVWLHLSGGNKGHWIEVPARIPLALSTE